MGSQDLSRRTFIKYGIAAAGAAALGLEGVSLSKRFSRAWVNDGCLYTLGIFDDI